MTTARTITPRQVSALKVYARDVEGAARDLNPSSRRAAQDGLTAAQAGLTPREVAILKVVVVGGRAITDIATAAGQSASTMEDLFFSAVTKLADHYEARVSSLF